MSDQNKCKRKQNDQQPDAKRPRMDTDSKSEECTNMEDKQSPTMDQTETEEDECSDEDEKSVSMIRPTLLRQLQTILSEYPDDAQILREMVQNAEDAGATCMKIMYDNRAVDPGGTSDIRQYFKTPAICVYNDAMFTDKDWEGIITIYNSCKEKEPLKVGRFGLGFKSVFHMTDSPVIISGKKLLVIDPLKSEKNEQECKDIPLKILRKKHCPEVTLANILDRFGFNSDVLMKGLFKGTLFWFPLRQNESALSTTIYSEEKSEKLFSSFITEASYNLLFLKTLGKIEIQNHQNEPYFVLEMKGVDDTFNNDRKNFREQLNRLNNELPPSSIVSKFEAIIKTPCTEDQFVIVSCLTGSAKLSDKMKCLSTDKELHYSPYTGVAYCTRTDRPKKPTGHIFCFLPLPFTGKSLTGLPVHVNGFFDLEHNRRHLKESAANNDSAQTDKSLQWNNGMISELLPDSYYEVVQLLKERSETGGNSPELIHNYYSSIPAPDDVETSWKPLYEALCEKLVAEANFYTTQGGGKWIISSEALFTINDQDSDHTDIKLPKSVKDLLLDCKENLVEVPLHIIQTLKASGYTPEPVSPKMVCEKLKNNECWKSYHRDKKLELLTFIIQEENFTDLENIQLLPLNNNTFTMFSFSGTKRVYVVSDETAKLFPKLDEHLVSSNSVKDIIWKQLDQMANKGLFQLTDLKNEYLPIVLQATFDANCDRKNTHHFVQCSDSTLDLQWIRDVWKEISTRGYENLALFETVPLIPIVHDEHATTTHDNSRNKIEFLQLKGKYLMSSLDDHPPLPKSVSKAVELLGVRIISPTQPLIFPHVEVKEKYIRLPLPENVFKYFQEASSSSDKGHKLAMKINESLSDQERLELLTYLSNRCADIPKDAYPFLQMLKLFKQFDNLNGPEMVSIEENQTKLTNFEFPKGLSYPRKLLMNEFSEIIKYLGGIDIEEKDCIAETLDLMLNNNPMYSTDDMKKLMIYLTNRPKDILCHVGKKVEELVFIPSSDGKMYKLTDLFNFTSTFLRDLFQGEKGIFPTDEFIVESELNMPFLKDLKMKREEHVSKENLTMIAMSLHSSMNKMQKNTLHRKAESLITFLNKNPKFIMDKMLNIQDLRWIPVCISRPGGYTEGLAWYNSFHLCTPNEVKLLEFKYLAGSVIPLLEAAKFNEEIACYYGWNKPPEQQVVLKHLENVVKSFTMNLNTEYMLITKVVFKYFDDLRISGNLTSESIEKLSSMNCIPTNGHGFMSGSKVVIDNKNSKVKFKLEPYIFELFDDLKVYSKTFQALGVKLDVDFELLKSILETLKHKYDLDDVDEGDVKRDMTLSVGILQSVIDMGIDQTVMKDLCVPIKSSSSVGMKFEIVEKCTYISSKSSLSICTGLVDEKITYVHPDINTLAPKLGVASVTKRFIVDHNTLVLPWGQKEKLTTRIKNLLDSYTDGFAVPKELVQNADDAGATKVCFLYDERENMDCREGLFDEGLAECQGNALWVFNDAVFQENDFKNIIELGGKTKILQTDKIGKFGLGFCSVYNLTDVPSFVSKNTLVVLDPHLHHLGEAAIEMNPGLRVPLTKQYRMTFPNQFKPFNGVFGCNLSPNNKDDFNGTLFRFPLRTKKQAQTSEISNLEYTKREMVELLIKFAEAAANLLLFTQNVTEISVWYLNPKSIIPDDDKQLLFRTWKSPSAKANNSDIGYGILANITNDMKKGIISEKRIPLQEIDIGIEVSDTAKLLSGYFVPKTTVVSWIISWGTGTHSFGIADRLKGQGAIPVGSIAVPVERRGSELVSYRNINELQTGFYLTGRVFCFLPLPLETQLPFHINGCFMVEQDRKSLIRFNEDDKTNDGSSWNDSMLEDVIPSAFINLLLSVASRSRDVILEKNYWSLWPDISRTKNQDITSVFINSFYQNILHKDYPVFYRKTSSMVIGVERPLSSSTFLDVKFRNSQQNGQAAFECMLQFHDDTSVVMDMPLEIYEIFLKTDDSGVCKLHSRVVSKHMFFKQYFFTNLKDSYWHTTEMKDKRNQLVMEALRDVSLYYLLKETACIPSSISGILRQPSELVHPTELISELFDSSDERFPDSAFDEFKATLEEMGMMTKTIFSETLIERAISIKTLSPEMAATRSKAIMKYLNNNFINHLDAMHSLKNVPFLLVMSRPKHWKLPWKGDNLESGQHVVSPCSLFSPNNMPLVGSIGLILDIGENCVQENVLSQIGIEEVTIENVVLQMEVVANENLLLSDGLKDVCDRLYERLDHHLNSQPRNIDVINRLRAIQTKRIIFVDSEMVEPFRVAFNLSESCKPYLYELPTALTKYNDLWNVLGVQRCFGISMLIEVLKDIYKVNDQEQMSKDKTEGVIRILKVLCESLSSNKLQLRMDEKETIFIPDENSIMRHLLDVCYPEPDFPYDDDDVYIIHEDINMKMINCLGIMSKRHLYLSRFSDSISFGQQEELVTRLKGIIDAYPKDYSVLNELLQNADDAGASEIHFVYDLRQLGIDQIFDKKWEALQGPALCVFNNSCFTEKDLEGIQNLGKGSKSNDPTKTGQFGIGFNSVYHLTDVPSFLTRGPGTPEGGTFCIFDPHCSYLPVARPDKPGMRLNIERLKAKYSDVYEGYLQDLISSEIGTWFRFPLRSCDMARNSQISHKATLDMDMKKLLNEMKKRMKESLLFLSNIKKISISYIEKDTNMLSDTYSVCLSLPDFYNTCLEEFHSHLATESSLIRSGTKKLDQLEFKDIRYIVTLNDNKDCSDTWIVVQTFGFEKMTIIPPRILEAMSDGELRFLPRGGTAMHVCSKNVHETRIVKNTTNNRKNIGLAFCFLPLPIQTGLPVHINGHLSVFSNRNGLFEGEELKDDVRKIWNELLTTRNIANAYASCLDFARDMLSVGINDCDAFDCLDIFFDSFPHINKMKSNIWKNLALHVFRNITERELNVFPICPDYTNNLKQQHSTKETVKENSFLPRIIRWIPLQTNGESFKACFDDLSKWYSKDGSNEKQSYGEVSLSAESPMFDDSLLINEEESVVRKILVDAGMKLTCAPLWILRGIESALTSKLLQKHYNSEESFLADHELSPKLVVSFFKSWETEYKDKCQVTQVNIPVKRTLFGTVKKLSCVLRFCLLCKGNDTSLDGLPLLLNNNEELIAFSSLSSIILSEFCNLLPKSGFRFVHHDLVIYLKEFNKYFKNLDIATFSSLLDASLDSRLYKQRKPLIWNHRQANLPDRNWMEQFWLYLSTVDKISGLGHWCLFPAMWFDKQIALVPFDMAFTVVNYKSFDTSSTVNKDVLDTLQSLSIPTVNSYNKTSKHLGDYVASCGQPEKLLKCLIYHKNAFAQQDIDIKHCNSILTYFALHIETIAPQSMSSLKKLPVFISISNQVVTVERYGQICVVDLENTDMVYDGLEELANCTDTALIKHYSFHEKIYNPLNFKVFKQCSNKHKLYELYLHFILPNFEMLNREYHLKHLTFIRDKLLREMNHDVIILQSLEFVPSNKDGNRLKKACEFYSPHNAVFAQFLKSVLPPNPFNQFEWKEFMDLAGINKQVTKSQFIKFAHQVEQSVVNDKSVSKSKELVRHLFSQMETEFDGRFLEQIRQIRFVEGFLVPVQYSQIHPQFVAKNWIAFDGSIFCQHFKLMWTISNILPDYPEYAKQFNQSCLQKLHIQAEPTLKDVISHVNNVCHSLKRSTKDNKESTRFKPEFLTELFNEIYKYLGRQLLVDKIELRELQIRLQETPFIHIIDSSQFMKPKCVFIKETEMLMTIPPYLLRASEEYGQFFYLFRKLGVTDEAGLVHYIRVLANIKEEVKDRVLLPTELECCEKAVRCFLYLLQNKSEIEEIEEPVLFLLSFDNKLLPSSDLVFVDDGRRFKAMRRLQKQQNLNLMADMSQFKTDLDKCFQLLPLRMQPKNFRKVIREELSTDVNRVSWEVADRLQDLLSSESFIYYVKRLVLKTCFDKNQKLSETEKDQIYTKMRSVQVIALENVQTVLVHEGETIVNSHESKEYFFTETEGRTIYYITRIELNFSKWITSKIHHVASMVLRLCSFKVKEKYILSILVHHETNMDGMLQVLRELKAPDLDDKPIDKSWIPPPGTPVPQDCLDCLIPDFAQFSPGEYAVFEVCDTRDFVDKNEEAAIYIYVKVIKKIKEDIFPLYEINVGEGQIKEVLSCRLFKIIRTLDETWDLELHTDGHKGYSVEQKEKIFQLIEELLVEAYRLGIDNFRRVYKRLLLRWHPDKNSNSNFCSEVTKHILNFAELLQSRQINVSKIPKYRERYGNTCGSDWSAYQSRWEADVNRSRQPTDTKPQTYTFDVHGYADRLRQRHTNSSNVWSAYGSHVQQRDYPDPQPHMGRVWLKQAKNDIAAAQSLMNVATLQSYNWVCVTSQQAAEKAIKAVQISRDARKVTDVHSLMTTITMNDPTLKDAAQKLESLVGDYTKMRYPRPVFFPDTPSDLYKEDHAKEAIRLAKIIVSTVDDMM